jgi:N6-L-threonylcarbamoyladenine synthase
MLESIAEDHNAISYAVPIEYTGDCGAQIACSGQFMFRAKKTVPLAKSYVMPRWRLDEAEVTWIPRL